jgi:hypothetical protein
MARIEFEQPEVPFDDAVHSQIASEDVEFEDEEDRVMYPDRRILLLGEGLRALIYQRFGGDVDLAQLHAERLVHLYRTPPAWATELHGAHRTGWTVYDKAQAH